uniref:Uncharacterized protein n=1 Tax=Arundo donax TaxID=35708 RepID=A0A0A9HTP8_ARUDO
MSLLFPSIDRHTLNTLPRKHQFIKVPSARASKPVN